MDFSPLLTLAQIAAPSALEFGGWMLCLWSAVGLWNGVNKARRDAVGEPPPGERFATKEEVAELRKDLADVRREIHELGEKLTDKMTANYNAIMTSEAGARSRLHSEINAVAALAQRLLGAIERDEKTRRTAK